MTTMANGDPARQELVDLLPSDFTPEWQREAARKAEDS